MLSINFAEIYKRLMSLIGKEKEEKNENKN